MKQRVPPYEQTDYSFLSPLNATLQELFLDGRPTMSDSFQLFTALNTLSLGQYEKLQL